MITQRDLLYFQKDEEKQKKIDKTYFILAGLLAEMEEDDPRRRTARKLLYDYAGEMKDVV